MFHCCFACPKQIICNKYNNILQDTFAGSLVLCLYPVVSIKYELKYIYICICLLTD